MGKVRKLHTRSRPWSGKTGCAADAGVSTDVWATSGSGERASIDARRDRKPGTGRTHQKRLRTRVPLRPPECKHGGRSRNPRITGPEEVQRQFFYCFCSLIHFVVAFTSFPPFNAALPPFIGPNDLLVGRDRQA